ncbi:MAG: GTPase [Rhodospirillales bacterium]|nr:MAG: GTPase [Rhodospirillales bacterium]
MTDAMKMVRDELGEDAIIVSTREENGGRTVRLTAAVEERFDPQEPTSDAISRDWMYADDDDESMVIEEITETMLRHAVPEDVLDQVVSCASVLGLDDPRAAMISTIESLFKFSPLPDTPSDQAFMLVGPPGAGKTLAAAKLAARSAMGGLNTAVITTDTVRAGGVEQLQAFTRLMNIDLKKASTPNELKACLLETREADQVIIDTAGTNPFDPDSVKMAARFIGCGNIEPVLILPAGADADESGDIARIFSTIGARSLLPTRVDVARRLGGLLSAAHQGGLSFADISDTAKVADGLAPLSAKRLTQLLMPRAEDAKLHKIRKAG